MLEGAPATAGVKIIMPKKLTPAEEVMVNTIVEYTKRTRDTAEGVSGWGGPREGAGRPATGRKRQQLYVTDEENIKLREYLEQLRKKAE